MRALLDVVVMQPADKGLPLTCRDRTAVRRCRALDDQANDDPCKIQRAIATVAAFRSHSLMRQDPGESETVALALLIRRHGSHRVLIETSAVALHGFWED